jgi:hypothetical protein
VSDLRPGTGEYSTRLAEPGELAPVLVLDSGFGVLKWPRPASPPQSAMSRSSSPQPKCPGDGAGVTPACRSAIVVIGLERRFPRQGVSRGECKGELAL